MKPLIVFLIGVVGVLMYIAYHLLNKKSAKDQEFREQDAHRCLTKACEIPKDRTPTSRAQTFGFMIVDVQGQTRIIQQSKLCDIGLLE